MSTPKNPKTPIAANPPIVWYHARMPQGMALQRQHEWHEALRQHLRGRGLVVHQEAGFGVAIPIGRGLLKADRHEILNFATTCREGMTLDISDGEPVEDLLDCCEALVRGHRVAAAGDRAAVFSGLGLQMVLVVVTRALIEWRRAIDALQRLH